MSEPSAAASPVRYREAIELTSTLLRVTEDNPGMFTGPGTNTHIVGTRDVLVVDPGEDRPDGHFEALIEAIGDRDVVGIIPSHGHPDHWPMAPRLRDHFGAPILAFASYRDITADQLLQDGAVVSVDGCSLTAVHTPGHASDHMAFVLEDDNGRSLLSGDHVMGWSTTIISPPDGNLNQFLDSLERLLEIEVEVMYPAHGAAVLEPRKRMLELREHRHERTRQALAALQSGPATIAQLVATIYRDVDERLHSAAQRSLWAHLEALYEEQRVERIGDGDDGFSAVWRLTA